MNDKTMISLFETLLHVVKDSELRLRGDIINCESQLRNEIRDLKNEIRATSAKSNAGQRDSLYDTDEFQKTLP